MNNKEINKIKEIEEIDKTILKLFTKRNKIIKNSSDLNFSFHDKKLIEKIRDNNFLKLLEISPKPLDEENEKIVYLGPEGSYTQEAAINKFRYYVALAQEKISKIY
jgi:chorismate mutase/prephenate dehydratase